MTLRISYEAAPPPTSLAPKEEAGKKRVPTSFHSLPFEIRLIIYKLVIDPALSFKTLLGQPFPTTHFQYTLSPTPAFFSSRNISNNKGKFTIADTEKAQNSNEEIITTFHRTLFRKWDYRTNYPPSTWPTSATAALCLTSPLVLQDLSESFHLTDMFALRIVDDAKTWSFCGDAEVLRSEIRGREWLWSGLVILRVEMGCWRGGSGNRDGRREMNGREEEVVRAETGSKKSSLEEGMNEKKKKVEDEDDDEEVEEGQGQGQGQTIWTSWLSTVLPSTATDPSTFSSSSSSSLTTAPNPNPSSTAKSSKKQTPRQIRRQNLLAFNTYLATLPRLKKLEIYVPTTTALRKWKDPVETMRVLIPSSPVSFSSASSAPPTQSHTSTSDPSTTSASSSSSAQVSSPTTTTTTTEKGEQEVDSAERETNPYGPSYFLSLVLAPCIPLPYAQTWSLLHGCTLQCLDMNNRSTYLSHTRGYRRDLRLVFPKRKTGGLFASLGLGAGDGGVGIWGNGNVEGGRGERGKADLGVSLYIEEGSWEHGREITGFENWDMIGGVQVYRRQFGVY